MRTRDVDPTGRRIMMDNIASTAAFLESHGIDQQVVDLTISAAG